MNDVRAGLSLDSLDDHTARFCGADVERFEGQHAFFGAVEYEGKFPLLVLPREQWVDMGCPTVLILTLSEWAISDSPSV